VKVIGKSLDGGLEIDFRDIPDAGEHAGDRVKSLTEVKGTHVRNVQWNCRKPLPSYRDHGRACIDPLDVVPLSEVAEMEAGATGDVEQGSRSGIPRPDDRFDFQGFGRVVFLHPAVGLDEVVELSAAFIHVHEGISPEGYRQEAALAQNASSIKPRRYGAAQRVQGFVSDPFGVRRSPGVKLTHPVR